MMAIKPNNLKEIKVNCPICGGSMIGDGYTLPIHCENVDIPTDIEPDCKPIYCNETEMEEE